MRRYLISVAMVLALFSLSCGEEDDYDGRCAADKKCFSGQVCDRTYCLSRVGVFCVRNSECLSGKCKLDNYSPRCAE